MVSVGRGRFMIDVPHIIEDCDDFAFQPEEQQVDETYEQFEERVLNKRAGHMYHIVKSKLMRADKLFLSEMVHRNNRKQVRSC
jgi:cohesin complex subunit SCC1